MMVAMRIRRGDQSKGDRPRSSDRTASERKPLQGRLTGSAALAGQWFDERTRVAVGRDVTVSGRLKFHEPVRIEGRFSGEVSSTELIVIGQHGTLEGRVYAPRVAVMGELRGDAVGLSRMVLGPHSRVTGNIETQRLSVCEGAYLDCYIRMRPAGRKREKETR